jgi:hypothetical protein
VLFRGNAGNDPENDSRAACASNGEPRTACATVAIIQANTGWRI